MTSPAIQILGQALANISGVMKETARQDAQGAPNPVMADHMATCIRSECNRIRSAGIDGIPEALESLAVPLDRLIREGW